MTLRLAPSVMRAKLAHDEVLLNTETGQYHLVNRTGREVLVEIERSGTADGARDRLVAETGAPIETVEDDVMTFVDALLARGLLVQS